ncbi:hypothetical protein LTR86_001779 [Recurvomyces mirabilis]|nr:hypothetical protein LTR86_001779 [Recurvomyces mirabilis]
MLAVASSAGHLFFYDLALKTSEGPRLVTRAHKMICRQDLLVLYLAWHPTKADTVAVTLSDGRVCLCTSTVASRNRLWLHHGSEVSTFTTAKHTLEPWVLAFMDGANGEQGGRVLSGGDDMVMQLSHVVTVEDREVGETVWRDSRVHQAGVTALLPLGTDLVLTGSYDDHIRLVSTPTSGRRVALAELNLDGGVWRLQVLQDTADTNAGADADASTTVPSGEPMRTITILASCMHAGTRIVSLTRQRPQDNSTDDDQWRFEVVAKFEEHESMNYGSDVQPTAEESRAKTIVSTSFYDRKLCLWRYDLKDAVVG